MHLLRRGALAIYLLLAAILLTGCTGTPETPEQIPPNRYVFLDDHTFITGEMIEGANPGFMFIDFPTYRFNATDGTLCGIINFEMNETLIAIYGSGRSLLRDAGSGSSTILSGVYDLPFSRGNLIIEEITFDGKVWLSFNTTTVVLRPGESWNQKQEEIRITPENRMRMEYNRTIINYGIMKKSDIQGRC
jgi:hypothetical protein